MSRRAARWAAAGGFLFLVALLVDLGAGYGVDDFWFLQVVERVLHGEALYRDVYFGVTPLAVYLTAAPVAVTGGELAAVKATCALLFAVSGLLSLHVAARTGRLKRGELLLMAGALAAFATTPSATPYAPLALAAVMGSLVAVLSWTERSGRRTLALAGALAGVALASKQSVGVAAVLALLASLALCARLTRTSAKSLAANAGTALAGVVAATLLALAPVIATRGLSGLARHAAGKGAYLDRARISYLQGLQDQLDELAVRGPLDAAESLARMAAYLLPPMALAALAAALLLGPSSARPRLAVVGLFWGAAMSNLLPRADLPHMSPAAPASLLLMACALAALRERLPLRLPLRAAAALVAAALLATAANPLQELVSGDSVGARVPHLRWVLIDAALQRDLEGRADAIASAGRHGPTFLLLPDAGMYYLLSGLPNPTAYDYPLVTTLGERGEREIIGLLRRGEIRQVCAAALPDSNLNDQRLLAYVRTNMQSAGTPGCRLFRTRG